MPRPSPMASACSPTPAAATKSSRRRSAFWLLPRRRPRSVRFHLPVLWPAPPASPLPSVAGTSLRTPPSSGTTARAPPPSSARIPCRRKSRRQTSPGRESSRSLWRIPAVAPARATAGGGGFTLTVTGTNFIADSVVDWNGAARATSFQSATSLQAQILSTDLATPGTIEITVLNTSSNGAAAFSNQFPFTINAAAGSAVKFPQVVSVSIAGGPADGPSEAPAISSGGRYVAFYSQAKNLIAPAASGNIFVRDTCVSAANCSAKTSAVDVAPDGSAPNGKAGRQVAISGDGRFVAFISRATNLVPGNTTVSLGYWELYVRDLCVGANAPSGCAPHTEIISTGAEGEAASGPSTSPSLSADGRFIAFVSAATNLVAEKPASLPQAYVRDTCAGPTATKACVVRTVAVPVDDEDRVAGAQAGRPAISSDGRYVALEMWSVKSATQNSAGTSQIALADTCMGIDAPVSCEVSAERISYAPDDSPLSGANISPSLSD